MDVLLNTIGSLAPRQVRVRLPEREVETAGRRLEVSRRKQRPPTQILRASPSPMRIELGICVLLY